MLTRSHDDNVRTFQFRDMYRAVPHAACSPVYEDGLTLEYRLMLVRLKRVRLIVPQLDHKLPRGEQRTTRRV